MCDRDFISFLRKPERIFVQRMKTTCRVIMSIDDKIFTAEDVNITKAVHQCAKLLYPNFLKFRNLGKQQKLIWKSLSSEILPFVVLRKFSRNPPLEITIQLNAGRY